MSKMLLKFVVVEFVTMLSFYRNERGQREEEVEEEARIREQRHPQLCWKSARFTASLPPRLLRTCRGCILRELHTKTSA